MTGVFAEYGFEERLINMSEPMQAADGRRKAARLLDGLLAY